MSAIREALEAAQDAMSDAENFWGLDFDAALRKIDAALALEADTLIQSVASSSRDGKQPGTGKAPPRSCQAATLPHPCANPSLRMATGVDGSKPSALSFDDPCLSAQMAMGIS